MCDAWLIWALRLIRAGAAISWPALLFRWFPYSLRSFTHRISHLFITAQLCLAAFWQNAPGLNRGPVH